MKKGTCLWFLIWHQFYLVSSRHTSWVFTRSCPGEVIRTDTQPMCQGCSAHEISQLRLLLCQTKIEVRVCYWWQRIISSLSVMRVSNQHTDADDTALKPHLYDQELTPTGLLVLNQLHYCTCKTLWPLFWQPRPLCHGVLPASEGLCRFSTAKIYLQQFVLGRVGLKLPKTCTYLQRAVPICAEPAGKAAMGGKHMQKWQNYKHWNSSSCSCSCSRDQCEQSRPEPFLIKQYSGICRHAWARLADLSVMQISFFEAHLAFSTWTLHKSSKRCTSCTSHKQSIRASCVSSTSSVSRQGRAGGQWEWHVQLHASCWSHSWHWHMVETSKKWRLQWPTGRSTNVC